MFDYHNPRAEQQILDAIDARPLAGTIAIGQGSLSRTRRIVRNAAGSKRLASAYPSPMTKLRAHIMRREGIMVSTIWGGTPTTTSVGTMIYEAFLPRALDTGQYVPAPTSDVVGHGLSTIPDALSRLRKGVSARKIVITVD